MSRWNRSDILALIGVITGSIGLIAGVVTQEIRCKVGLQQNLCPLTRIEIEELASLFTQAETNYKQSNYRKAINDLNKIIELDPTHADTYYLLGIIYNNYYPNKTEAINNFKKAADLFFDKEKHNDGFRSRGTALSLEGNYKEAIQDLNEAIHLNPKDFKAYSNRGLARIKLEDYEGAIEDFSQAISIDPSDIAYSNLGFAYFNLGNYEKAIENSNEAIRINPRFYNPYINRGAAYLNLGNYEKAIEDSNEAIRIDPNIVNAYINRGAAYFNLGNYKKAIEDSHRAIRINPNDPNILNAYFNLGVAYKQIGDEQKAIENFQEVINQKGNEKLHQIARRELKRL